MPDYLEQGPVRVQLGDTPWMEAAGMTLCMGQIGIIDATAAGTFEFTADRAGRTAKAFSNGSGGAQVGAHGHDDGALLGGQMLVDFWHGSTLQQRVLHLVFENAHPMELKIPFIFCVALHSLHRIHRRPLGAAMITCLTTPRRLTAPSPTCHFSCKALIFRVFEMSGAPYADSPYHQL